MNVGVLTQGLSALFHISMMIISGKYKVLLLVWTIFYGQAFGMDKNQFFKQSSTFFQSNVENGLVKYSQIKKNRDDIDDLIVYLSEVDVTTFKLNEKLAFYINAYNLIVIAEIVSEYPIDSPMSLAGFFDRKKHIIAEESLTLNDLENNKIRAYHDPRIHFVLVCAALGCPKLANYSYVPEKLETQLIQQTQLALNDPEFIQVHGNDVKISEIFNWYTQDFGKSDEDLITFINKFRKNPLAEKSKFSYYSYNWKLNESK